MLRSEWGALTGFVNELRRLRHMAGSPSLNRLVTLTASLDRPLRRSTISDKLNAKSLPEWDFVVSFTTACRLHAEEAGRPLPDDIVDLAGWDSAYWGMLRVLDRVDADERLAAAAKAELGRRASHSVSVSGQRSESEPPTFGRVPHQLPLAARHFAGRASELATLGALLAQAAGSTDPVVILAIEGTAGIGKSTLAIHWAHRAAHRFPDGQLYVNLCGFHPTESVTEAAEAAYGFLQALGVPADQIPSTLEARAGLFRSLLAGRRMLVVLDNARDADHVRPLLPGTSGCLVVVTSRSQLASLVAIEGAHSLQLDLLSPDDAGELLRHRLGEAQLLAEPLAVDAIVAGCARLPLALSIVAARAARHPEYPLAALAAGLRDLQGPLDALDGGAPGTDIRSVFSCSYRQLSPPAARLFRLLSLCLGADVAEPAAASLTGLTPAQVRRHLTELTRAHLLSEHQPNRYLFHDLLRAYATELAKTQDSGPRRNAAGRRLLDHYVHTAHAASLLLNPHHRELRSPPPCAVGVAITDLSDRESALAWFAAEHPALLATIRQAIGSGQDTHAHQLTFALSVFLTRRGRWPEMVATQRTALDAAQRLADRGCCYERVSPPLGHVSGWGDTSPTNNRPN